MLTKFEFLALYRIFFGVLTVVAIGIQLAHSLQIPSFSIVSFFSFFTIQSNVVAAGLFIIVGIAMLMGVRKGSQALALLRGAATLYMLITGIVYAVLLSNVAVQLTLPWVNVVLHFIMPAAVLIDWLVMTPKRPISFRKALVWLVFPFTYVIYSLIRGAIVDWYPYPFLDPLAHGYGQVVLASIVIACGALALSWLLVKMTAIPQKQRLFK